MQYRFYNGKQVDNVKNYVKEYIRAHPAVEIYIGTDSNAHNNVLTLVTTICFHRPSNGVHYIYTKITEPRPKDLYSRIWREVELTYEVAELIRPAIGEKRVFLDVDINSLPQHQSHIAYGAAYGLLNGIGYSVRFKPQAYATHAADWLLR